MGKLVIFTGPPQTGKTVKLKELANVFGTGVVEASSFSQIAMHPCVTVQDVVCVDGVSSMKQIADLKRLSFELGILVFAATNMELDKYDMKLRNVLIINTPV